MAFTMPALRRFDYRWLAWLLLFIALAAPAQTGEFRVTALEGRFHEELLYADARIDYELSATALEALESGVALVIAQTLQLERPRWWWRSQVLLRQERRYRLQYHAISRRYVLTWLVSGDSRSYRSLDALLIQLGRVEAWPMVRADTLKPDTGYQLRLQTRLELETLPRLLRTVAWVDEDWRLESGPRVAAVER